LRPKWKPFTTAILAAEDVKFSSDRYQGVTEPRPEASTSRRSRSSIRGAIRFQLKDSWPDFMTFTLHRHRRRSRRAQKYMPRSRGRLPSSARIGAGPTNSSAPSRDRGRSRLTANWRWAPAVKKLIMRKRPPMPTIRALMLKSVKPTSRTRSKATASVDAGGCSKTRSKIVATKHASIFGSKCQSNGSKIAVPRHPRAAAVKYRARIARQSTTQAFCSGFCRGQRVIVPRVMDYCPATGEPGLRHRPGQDAAPAGSRYPRLDRLASSPPNPGLPTVAEAT